MSGRRHAFAVWWLALTAALLRPAVAQDAPAAATTVVRVEVTVTAVAGNSAYLDKGRTDHIESGDRVVLRPLGAAEVQAVVRQVTRNSCRVELPAGVTSVAINDRGEVLVPKARVDAAAAAPATGAAPDHPAWTSKDPGYAPDQPLLTPAVGQAPEDRPMQVHGRFYMDFSGSWDTTNNNDFQLWRSGIDVTVENPFGDGGEAHVDAEGLRNISNLGSGSSDTTDTLRLDRASYAWGGTRDRPDRFEAGRFVQENVPELGVLDGIEVSHRLDSGDRFGGSFGYIPTFFPEMTTGHDLQAAVFYRSDAGAQAPLAWGLAYQNTWHDGSQDRNLFVGDFDAALSKDVSLSGEALVDYYGPGGDPLKPGGFQVTEAHLSGRWRLDPHYGVGVHASQMRWPELKSAQFGDLPPEQVQNGEVTRFGVDGWKDLTENLRMDGRVDAWTDQTDSGNSADLRTALRDVLWEHGDIALDLFETSGSSTDGQGVRVSATHAFDSLGYGTLSWETANYTTNLLGSVSSNTSQQAVRASLDRPLGPNWSASFFAEHRTGDVSSNNVGIYLQERF